MSLTAHPEDPAPRTSPGGRRLSRRGALGLGGLSALAVGGLAAWAYMPGGYLTFDARLFRALKTDPMAAIPLLGREPRSIGDHEPPGLVSIEHTTPYLERFFRDDSIGQQALHLELITYAQQVGWTHNSARSMGDRWAARRPHQTFTSFALAVYPLHSTEPGDLLHQCVTVSIFYSGLAYTETPPT